MDKINYYRKRIDKIDQKISKNIAQRINLVKEFWEWKKANNILLTDKKRETEVITRNAEISGLRREFMKKIFVEIKRETSR